MPESTWNVLLGYAVALAAGGILHVLAGRLFGRLAPDDHPRSRR